jgi:hypothetical protein
VPGTEEQHDELCGTHRFRRDFDRKTIIYQDRLGTNATTTDKTMAFSLAANTMCPWNSLEVHTASTDTPRFDQLDWMQFNEKVRRLNTSAGANMVLFLFPLLSLWKR